MLTDSYTTSARKLPPGPRGSTFLGSFMEFRRTDLLTFARKCYNEFGDIVHLKLGPQHFFFLCNPGDVAHVLKTHSVYDKTRSQKQAQLISGNSINTLSFRDWKTKASTLARSLGRIDPAVHAAAIDRSLDDVFARWECADGLVNVSQDMLQLSVATAARLFLGIDPSLLDSAAINFHKYRIVRQVLVRIVRLVNPPIALSKELRESIHYREDLVRSVLERFLAGPPGTDSYLGRLVDKYGITDAGSKDAKRAAGEILGALYLGSDPMDKLLSWALYYLTMYPLEREKVIRELDEVTGGSPISFSQTSSLKHFRSFLCEVLLARLLQRFDFTLVPTYDYSDLFLGTLGSREEIRMSVKAAREPRRLGTASKSSGNYPEPLG